MSDANIYQHGAFSWNELMSHDIDASKSFYSELLGWVYEDMPMPDGNRYTSARIGDDKIAGLYPTPEEAKETPSFWGSYITVDDVTASLDKAVSLGAKIIVPLTEIAGVGKFCMLQDPQGAMVSLITYEEADKG